jgi:hypothetical protein
MKILVPTLRFVARASRRAASTVVSTFFSAITAIRLEVQREIKCATPIFDGVVSAGVFTTVSSASGFEIPVSLKSSHRPGSPLHPQAQPV